ncbi:hypothetical protein BDR22DRAFT_894953 [Usnea florida]
MDRQKCVHGTKQALALISAYAPEAMATLPQRIGESASELIQASFQRPSPNAVIGGLASLNTETKAGSSSGSTSTCESSLELRSSPSYEQATSHQGDSFRSPIPREKISRTHGQVAFDEFLARPKDFGHEPEFLQEGSALGSDPQMGVWMGPSEYNVPRVQNTKICKTQSKNQSLAEQNGDGAAVVALLLDPSFAADEGPRYTVAWETHGTEGQKGKRMQSRKREESIDVLHTLNSLSLIPDFGPPSRLFPASLATQRDNYRKQGCLEQGPGDVQSWIDILDRYHDEVWGDLLPLVQESRQELKMANENKTCLQSGPAIQRLKMILQHLGNFENR